MAPISGNTPGLEQIRDRIGASVRTVLSGGQSSSPDEVDLAPFSEPPGDPGLFGPDSVAWKVHADPAMLIGGIRSLLMQTTHPLAMAGVAERSNYRTDPWGRLHRTAQYVTITSYGGTAQAQRAIRSVKAIHKRVKGVAPDGRPYSASDPDLVTWVHVTEVDSFLTSVQRFGTTQLAPEQADRYVDEMAQLGLAMGAKEVPRSVADIAAYYKSVDSQLEAGPQARSAIRFLMWPPVPSRIRPAYAVLAAAAVSTMPMRLRKMLWLPETPSIDKALVVPAGELCTAVLGWALGPSPVVEAALRRAGATDAAG